MKILKIITLDMKKISEMFHQIYLWGWDGWEGGGGGVLDVRFVQSWLTLQHNCIYMCDINTQYKCMMYIVLKITCVTVMSN